MLRRISACWRARMDFASKETMVMFEDERRIRSVKEIPPGVAAPRWCSDNRDGGNWADGS